MRGMPKGPPPRGRADPPTAIPVVSPPWWRTAAGRVALGAAMIVALVAAAYYPALWGTFVWDDVIFAEEPVIHAARGVWNIWFSPGDIRNEGHYWPIVYTTLWLEHKLWGLEPAGYHAVNIALHAGNALLVWRLMARLSVPGAWLVAAVFAVHPLHVESVAWIIERKDLLSGAFYLGAVLAWIRFRESARARPYALALALFVAAMLSKSVAMTLPAALAVWQWWRHGRVSLGDWIALAPFFAVGLGIALADYAFYASRESVDLGYTIAERMQIAGRALWFYAGKLAWPADLAVIYPLWEVGAGRLAAWAFVAGAAALAAVLWFARLRLGRGPLAGALFYAVALAPMLGFVDYGYMQFSFVADRFQYLAGAGVIAVLVGAAATGAARLPAPGRVAAWVAATGVVLALGVLTWRQAGVYRDEVTLFGHVVAHNPTARDAHQNLGSALLDAGRIEEGIEASRIAAAQRPEMPGPLANIGRALIAQKRFEEAEAVLQRALELAPRNLAALQNLGEMQRRRGRIAQAEAAYRQALAVDDGYALAHAGLGHVLAQAGRHEEGLGHMSRALAARTDPDLGGKLHIQMGRAARELGRLEAAARYFGRAVVARPDSPEPLFELAVMRVIQGRAEEAEGYRRRALELGGDSLMMLHTLAESLRKAQRLDEAIAVYRQALDEDPDFAPAYAGLGLGLHKAGRHAEAVAAMDRALALDPDLPVAASLHMYSGDSLGALGQPRAAEERYERALAVDPRNGSALDRLAMSRFGTGRYAEALTLYRTLDQVNPGSATTHANLGATLYHLGRHGEALVEVERALALDPDHAPARAGLAEVRKALRRAR